jgi:cobalt-zinc-cadmium efflux system protein
MSGGHGHGTGGSEHGHPHANALQPGHAHGHGHAHGFVHGAASKLAIALALTGVFFFVEVAAGIWTESLALLSDAGHMLGDSGALVLALVAQQIAKRPRTRAHTFGFRRAETLAALFNGGLLLVTCGLIVHEALGRLSAPHLIRGGPMLLVSAIGLLVNLIAAWVLGHGESNANVRAALLHVLSDALGSLASIFAALCVLYWNLPAADTLASLCIALLIAFSSLRLLKDTASLLMERTPPHVNLVELEELVRSTRGVADLHDLHAWAISDGFDLVTVHVVLDGESHGTDVARAVGERIRARYGIDHVTVQPESPPASAQLLPVTRLTEKRRS